MTWHFTKMPQVFLCWLWLPLPSILDIFTVPDMTNPLENKFQSQSIEGLANPINCLATVVPVGTSVNITGLCMQLIIHPQDKEF